MGRYLNPKGMTKENWLMGNAVIHGDPIDTNKGFPTKEGHFVVVYVLNSGFSACAHIGDQQDWDAFSVPSDPRPKVFLWVENKWLDEFL